VDPLVQQRIDELAGKCSQGLLTPEERQEYEIYVRVGSVVSILQAKARLLYEDVSPPRPKMDLIDRILKGPPVIREKGAGRPTKKERRAIEKLQE